MPYQPSYLTDLNNIIAQINANNILAAGGALELFTTYINSIQQIGPFTTTDWPITWRKAIWDLGKEIRKSSPLVFFNAINPIRQAVDSEALHFIHSEMIHDYLPNDEILIQLQDLVVKYPHNPEFRHSLGHYYRRVNNYLEAIAQYKFAIGIELLEEYTSSKFAVDQDYLRSLLSDNKYNEGMQYIEATIKEGKYGTIANNSLIDYYTRFEDHVAFNNKMDHLQTQYKNAMQDELAAERRRVIEVLGFFSAIVAFILSTVSIAKSFSFKEAISFLIALGLVLILFLVSLIVLFDKSAKPVLKDIKFWVLIVGLILLSIQIFVVQPLVSFDLIFPINR